MGSESAVRTAMKQFLLPIERVNVALAALAVALTHLIAGPGTILYGVLAGALVNVANWRAIVWLAGRVVAGGRSARGFFTIIAGLKLVVLMTIVGLVLLYLPVHPVGFLIGLSTMLPAIVGVMLHRSLNPETNEEQQA